MLAARDRRRRGRGLESAATAARRARVDAALVGLLFCGGLRRAEASALVWADVEPTERDEQLRVRIRASKTNPEAEHEDFRLLLGGLVALGYGTIPSLFGSPCALNCQRSRRTERISTPVGLPARR